MAADFPEHATAFIRLFARVEHTLRRNGYGKRSWALQENGFTIKIHE